MHALFTGSFDPVTIGHLDLIERIAALAESVLVLVAVNPEKRPIFSGDERVEMLQAVCRPWPNVTVQQFSGLVVEAARAQNISVIVRGVRSSDDMPHELQMAHANRALSGIETLLLPASPSLSYISATLVREVGRFGGDITPFVPTALIDRVRARLTADRA